MDSETDFLRLVRSVIQKDVTRGRRGRKGENSENETEYVFMGMYLLVRHYRIVWRKTFVINKWYTCIRDHGRYIPCHMSSALPALVCFVLESSLRRPCPSYGNHANSLTNTLARHALRVLHSFDYKGTLRVCFTFHFRATKLFYERVSHKLFAGYWFLGVESRRRKFLTFVFLIT